MHRSRVSTLLAELKACSISKDLQRGKNIHKAVVQNGDDSNIYVANTLINMYGRCGSLHDSRLVFDSMKQPDIVSWNALILGHVHNGEYETSLDLFSRMASESASPDARTFLAVLKACIELGSRERGKVMHLLASSSGWDSDMYVENMLVSMLSQFGFLKEARAIFDGMRFPDVVAWTSMILGYAENGEGETGLYVFSEMSCTCNTRSFVAALKSCTDVKKNVLERGKAIHLLASVSACDSDIYVQNTLMDLYVKCGSLSMSRIIFEGMSSRNVVSWTALMVGYADNGEGTIVLELFTRMKNEGCEPNAFTFVSVLKACSMLGKLDFGRLVHGEICRRAFQNDVVLANSLVDFYAKCGSLAEAEQVCKSHPGMNLVTWTSLITGYCRHGDAQMVFSLFERMCDTGIEANNITFLCVLTACSHAGFVNRGIYYFKMMSSKYGIEPDVEHYTCMVDILGRANKLDEAMLLLRSMTLPPDVSTWLSVLGACRKWKHINLGSLVFEALISLDDKHAVAYLLKANI